MAGSNQGCMGLGPLAFSNKDKLYQKKLYGNKKNGFVTQFKTSILCTVACSALTKINNNDKNMYVLILHSFCSWHLIILVINNFVVHRYV